MPTVFGALRRIALAPSLAEVSYAKRGLVAAAPAVAARLEAIPRAVIVGFEAGIEARDLQEIEWRLHLLDEELRGFGYEGATMALSVLDRMLPSRRSRTRELLLGPAQPFMFLTYIGIGFAMARLPRARWKGILPDLGDLPYYPDISWLAVDGYGFDLAYFHPERWVHQQRVPAPYPWLGRSDYFPRAVDQGIGRALWFLYGADVTAVTAAVRGFAAARQPDLWSGVGLAAAFAGAATPADLARLAEWAGDHRTHLAQGAAFAAKARTFAGLDPQHTDEALRALTGLGTADAVALTDEAIAAADPDESAVVYEEWRRQIRRRFALDRAS